MVYQMIIGVIFIYSSFVKIDDVVFPFFLKKLSVITEALFWWDVP